MRLVAVDPRRFLLDPSGEEFRSLFLRIAGETDLTRAMRVPGPDECIMPGKDISPIKLLWASYDTNYAYTGDRRQHIEFGPSFFFRH
jgi:hypothetical protein